LLEAGSPGDRETGARKWISVDGAEAPLLADDAFSGLGYSEFSELKSEMSRELVNEAIQALLSVWDAARARLNRDRNEHIPVAGSLRRLNRIGREADPVGAWEKLMEALLVRGRDTHGTVSGLRFESAWPRGAESLSSSDRLSSFHSRRRRGPPEPGGCLARRRTRDGRS